MLPGQDMSPHAEILATRAAALGQLANGNSGITLAPIAAALSRTEAPPTTGSSRRPCASMTKSPLDDLAAHLESVGYERRDPVEMVGEYSIRGGILDVFSPEQAQPVRIEFFGDEIESIRRFDPESQRSIHKLNECVLQPLTEFQKSRPFSPSWPSACVNRLRGAICPSMASRSPAGNCSSPPCARAPHRCSISSTIR